MKLTCRISTHEEHDTIRKLFATELERTHPRSTVTLHNEHGKAVFHIAAEDVTAMRAALNGITSILSVYEKTP